MQIKLIQESFCAWPHFKREGFWNSEGAYFLKAHAQKVLFFTATFLLYCLRF